jgi:hypothetical protein
LLFSEPHPVAFRRSFGIRVLPTRGCQTAQPSFSKAIVTSRPGLNACGRLMRNKPRAPVAAPGVYSRAADRPLLDADGAALVLLPPHHEIEPLVP